MDGFDLAYMAGIVDGEGHISINHQNTFNQFKVVLGVTNTDPRLIKWIQDRWFGSLDIRNYHDTRPYFLGTRDRMQWRLVGQKAVDVIILIRPWLIIKSEQADIAIAFWDLHEEYGICSGVPASQEYIDIAQGMWEDIRLLNTGKAYGIARQNTGKELA